MITFPRLSVAVALLAVVLIAGCGHSLGTSSGARNAQAKPTLAELTKRFYELDPGGKRVSITPSVAADATTDLTATAGAGGSVDLQWTEKNIADYNLDGEVGISDLIPLALRYGRTAPFTDPLDAVCDGNGDGEIGIADLAPMALYYGNKISAYVLSRYNTVTSTWATVTTVSRPGVLGPSGWPVYTYNDPSPLANSWYCVQPTDGGGYIGVPSNVVAAPGTVGSPPSPPEQVAPPPAADFNLSPGQVSAFSIPTTHTYSINTSGGSEKYLFIFYSLADTSTDTTYNLGLTRGTSTMIASAKQPAAAARPSSDYLTPSQRAEAEFWKRYYEKERENTEYAMTHPYAVLPKRPLVAGNVGDTHQFHVTFAVGGPSTMVTATCERYNPGDSLKIWVDNRVLDGRITPTLLDRLYNQMKQYAFPKENSTYGTPDDVDSDGAVDVLMTPEINWLPGLIRGMFYSGDLLTASDSNMSDMVYTEVPDTGPVYYETDPNLRTSQASFNDNIASTVAHENQHLRNYGNRLKYHNANPAWGIVVEQPWLDEGLAHFTEDFTGFQSQNNFVSPDFFMTTSYRWPLSTNMAVNVYQRGAAYLFVRYMVDRESASILPLLLDRDMGFAPLAGTQNILNATSESFNQLYGEWAAALALSGTGLTADARYNYSPTGTDPNTGAQTGIAFRSMNTPLYSTDTLVGGPWLLTEPIRFPLVDAFTVPVHNNAPIYVLVANPTAAKTTINVSVDPLNTSPLQGEAIRLADGTIPVNNGSTPFACNLNTTYIGYLPNASATQTWDLNMVSPQTVAIRLASADPANFTAAVDNIGGNPLPNMVPLVTGVYYFARLSLATPGMYDIHVKSQSGSGWYTFTVYAP
jgi:hypothetical protein